MWGRCNHSNEVKQCYKMTGDDDSRVLWLCLPPLSLVTWYKAILPIVVAARRLCVSSSPRALIAESNTVSMCIHSNRTCHSELGDSLWDIKWWLTELTLKRQKTNVPLAPADMRQFSSLRELSRNHLIATMGPCFGFNQRMMVPSCICQTMTWQSSPISCLSGAPASK